MRSVVRSLRHLRCSTQHHAEGHSATNKLIRQHNAVILSSSTSGLLSTILRHNDEVSRFVSPRVELLRNMFSTVAADSIKGFISHCIFMHGGFLFSFGGI